MGTHNPPNIQEIVKIKRKCEETGSVTGFLGPLHHCLARSFSNISTVRESVAEGPNVYRVGTFLRHFMTSFALGITPTSGNGPGARTTT